MRSAAKVSERVDVLDVGKEVFSGSIKEFTEDEEIAKRHLLV